jgi:dTDP-4-dehydrorhamnose reductase
VSDLDLVAATGIRTLRYPALWERVAPDGCLSRADWSWTDQRLGRLRELGVRPVVGLLHHGNGPAGTSLLDPDFPERFAEYARAVAERYPWVDAYVPVNEPLTTARFCGLYGVWYPHGRDLSTFTRILLHQLRATVLAMRTIRQVNPDAILIQNEDLGKTHSTPLLAYEAEFQNERRWLTFDLLCGRIDQQHPMRQILVDGGATEAELEGFVADPLPPDILGIDHYVSSERFLDEALDGYPPQYHGGNDRHTYADVEAVWSLAAGPVGVEALMEEAWDRYRRPMAMTEAHLGGTREEQIRWLIEVWNAASALADRGADIRAMTVWSLFGAYDWNTLVTAERGFYESGAFDVRGPEPRATAVSGVIERLARGETFEHPVLAAPGWWRRPERLIYGSSSSEPEPGEDAPAEDGVPLVAVVGDAGALAGEVRAALRARGLAYRWLDVVGTTDPEACGRSIEELRPWAVVDALGFADALGGAYEEDVLDASAQDPGALARLASMHRAVASAAAQRSIPFLLFGSWLVFAGDSPEPLTEGDARDADSALGRAWRRVEDVVSSAHGDALVVRAGPLLGSRAARLRGGGSPPADLVGEGAVVSPTFAPDMVGAALDLLIDGESGIWHLANPGAARVEPVRGAPVCAAMGTVRGALLPTLEDALGRWTPVEAAPADGRGASMAMT